jgi:hypothetical protein
MVGIVVAGGWRGQRVSMKADRGGLWALAGEGMEKDHVVELSGLPKDKNGINWTRQPASQGEVGSRQGRFG